MAKSRDTAVIRLWLLCCAVLFAGAEGYQWLSHQGWFVHPELGWPWVILAGMGLAIAAHYGQLKALWQPTGAEIDGEIAPSTASPSPIGPEAGTQPQPSPATVADTSPTQHDGRSPHPRPISRPTPSPPKRPQGKSISFDITPPHRRG